MAAEAAIMTGTRRTLSRTQGQQRHPSSGVQQVESQVEAEAGAAAACAAAEVEARVGRAPEDKR